MKKAGNRAVRLTALVALLVLLINVMVLPGRAQVQTGLEGKRLSVLGDSISTFAGVSNAASYNSTLAQNAVYYTQGTMGISREDTWWQQICDLLGMELLVNNSWSGSCMYMTGAGTKGAFHSRCVQLHNRKNVQPDIIAIFLGTNDQDYFPDTLGTVAEIDFDNLIATKDKRFVYAQPTTTMEAYAITLHKISQRYPQAEVYCMNLLYREMYTPPNVTDFNIELAKLTKYFGVHLVDLTRCGVTTATASWYMGDWLHPASAGMDAITGALISQILRSSRYVSEELTTEHVSYNLNNALILQGNTHTVVSGSPFRADVVTTTGEIADVRVLMGEEDITETCYTNGVISIEAVTGSVYIRANG